MTVNTLIIFGIFIIASFASRHGEILSQAYPHSKLTEIKDQNEFLRLLALHAPVHNELIEEQGRKRFDQKPTFNCITYGPSAQNPISVNEVRPSDIRVIGAMGDSLTAGFGALAYHYFDLFTEYRGVAWSVGGDGDISSRLSLSNFLKMYNPNLVGFSVGTGDATSKNAHLDVAVTGSRAPDMISQANNLVAKMKASSQINLAEDWKIITIWVGSNDLCSICEDPDGIYSPENYESNIRTAIKILHDNIPRVFLNLIQGIDPTELYGVNVGLCNFLHKYECPCGSSNDASVRATVTERLQEYNYRLIKIANDSTLQDDDFSIVIQPFLKKTMIPKEANGQPDMRYLAIDCFHFSGLAHEAAAVGIWNNLFQRLGNKTEKWTPGEGILCPQDGQFLSTIGNSFPPVD